MGLKAQEPIEIEADGLSLYLLVNHAAYMDYDGKSYYLTNVNDHFWRVQDTEKLNEKGHYVDASEPVSTLAEFLGMPVIDGKSLMEIFPEAQFYASLKAE